MDRDVYGSLPLKAAALLQSLTKLPCLEHSNEAFAWHACEAYLTLNGLRLDYPPKDAVALVRDAASGILGIARRELINGGSAAQGETPSERDDE
ncbi:hypothetical protein [Streptomyces sp. 8N706]|uniref:hypothetical protein n=1 Tax=Streptomyces sp. 8N706 TaxID=3457416 RepID=UPI003FCFCC27